MVEWKKLNNRSTRLYEILRNRMNQSEIPKTPGWLLHHLLKNTALKMKAVLIFFENNFGV